MKPGDELRSYRAAGRSVEVQRLLVVAHRVAPTLKGIAGSHGAYVDTRTVERLTELEGWNLSELARAAHLKPSTVKKLMLERKCSLATIRAIADALHVPVAGLACPAPVWVHHNPEYRGPDERKLCAVLASLPKPERKPKLFVDWKIVGSLLRERGLLERDLPRVLNYSPTIVRLWHTHSIPEDHAQHMADYFGITVWAITRRES